MTILLFRILATLTVATVCLLIVANGYRTIRWRQADDQLADWMFGLMCILGATAVVVRMIAWCLEAV